MGRGSLNVGGFDKRGNDHLARVDGFRRNQGRKEIRDSKQELRTIKTAADHRRLERESDMVPLLLKVFGVIAVLFLAVVLLFFREA